MSTLHIKQNSRVKNVSLIVFWHAFFSICLLVPTISSAQTQPEVKKDTGALQINVRVKVNDRNTPLRRRRFYLINGSLEDNKTLVDKIGRQSVVLRQCFYRNANASEAFINWLVKEVNCESVYCHSIDEKFLSGPTAVPEFQVAYEQSVKEYRSAELGRLWLTTNLTNDIRDGFYRQRQASIKSLLADAKSGASTDLNSVMTDSNGNANFTNLAPGTYLVSNLVPIELGDKSFVWTCQVEIAEDGKTTLQIPKQIKMCDYMEIPLPACDAKKQTASNK